MQATLKELFAAGADAAPALSAPGRAPLDFAGLRRLVDTTLAALNGIGIGQKSHFTKIRRKDVKKRRKPRRFGGIHRRSIGNHNRLFFALCRGFTYLLHQTHYGKNVVH